MHRFMSLQMLIRFLMQPMLLMHRYLSFQLLECFQNIKYVWSPDNQCCLNRCKKYVIMLL